MKIFVLGASHVGKTPFARRIAEAFGIPRVGASAWVRAHFPALPDDASIESRTAQIAAMTAYSQTALRADPMIAADSLRAAIATAGRPCVVEGIRNPTDFIATFDPRIDRVVRLRRTDAPVPTPFERGLDVITAHLEWLVANALLAPAHITTFDLDAFGTALDPSPPPRTLERAILDYIAITTFPTDEPAPRRVHADIPPMALHVRAEHLYGMDPARVGELRACTAFAVSSYPGSTPTFQIRLADGAVFSYIPATALLATPAAPDPLLELADLVYFDCKSTLITVDEYQELRGPALAYFKHRDLWLAATYRFTIDWYAGNELLHCLVLATGQLALLPSHKVKFGAHPPGFEPYRKIRREWTVTLTPPREGL